MSGSRSPTQTVVSHSRCAKRFDIEDVVPIQPFLFGQKVEEKCG